MSGVELCYLVFERSECITAWFDGDVVETDRLGTIPFDVDPEVWEVPDLVGTDDFCGVTIQSDSVSGFEFPIHLIEHGYGLSVPLEFRFQRVQHPGVRR